YELVAGNRTYDRNALNQTLEQLHRDTESGVLFKSYFGYLRRLAADIEDVASFGIIGDAKLTPWGEYRNPLTRPLTEEAKNDPDSIVGLAAKTYDMLAADGLADGTLSRLKHVYLLRLLRFFHERGEERYSEELIEQYIEELPSHEHEWGREKLFGMRSAAQHVKSVHDTGALYARMGPGAIMRTMSGPFADLLREYEQWALRSPDLSEDTAAYRVEDAAKFLEALRSLGVEDLANLTRELVRSARRSICEGKSQEYACRLLAGMRAFAAFSEQCHPEIPPFRAWIGRNPKKQKKAPVPGYSREQADAIIASIDLSAPAGPRNQAMLTLLKNTGLRGCDVVKLRREEIDWHGNKISIVQKKTRKPLVLPLDTETGTAIANYLLGPREERDEVDGLVFLTVSGEAAPLSRRRLTGIIAEHAKPALGKDYEGPHGTHAFRRGLGAGMVDAGVPLEDVAEVLGQSDVKSAESYAAVAFDKLREYCAASLDAAPAERIWWLK
ncbi:MAG: tyrosine-type recombinase/integrase, partial [Coriobacteriales bacterium]